MICEKCGTEMEGGYGLAGGGGVGPYFYCPKCYNFLKFPDPEMENDDAMPDVPERHDPRSE